MRASRIYLNPGEDVVILADDHIRPHVRDYTVDRELEPDPVVRTLPYVTYGFEDPRGYAERHHSIDHGATGGGDR